MTLPAEQHYAENTFGLGANTMVSVMEDNFLMYRNIGGFLRLSLYGLASVSSITLKGNNGEKLAGKASVSMPPDGVPEVVMADEATDEITLTLETLLDLDPSSENSTDFWFVVPPVTFSKGFTITVTDVSGATFEKSTAKSITIERNRLVKMSPMGITLPQPDNVIYYFSSDETVVTPYKTTLFGATLVSNEYQNGRGAITFDGPVTSIGTDAFYGCSTLVGISIPESVTSIGNDAFGSTGLTSIVIPGQVTDIGNYAFSRCYELSSVIMPETVTGIGYSAFMYCSKLASISLPAGLTSIASSLFMESGLTSITIPEGVTSIGPNAFYNCRSLMTVSFPSTLNSIGFAAFNECRGLTDITIPASVTGIGDWAFCLCTSLTSITVYAAVPPTGLTGTTFASTNECPIYVPGRCVDTYKAADGWSNYAHRIVSMTPLPEAVDLGLPSGIKWASFNVGASKPEEYGDYFAWGETEPYYSSQDPLTWKEGKEVGYDYSTYKWCSDSSIEMTKYCPSPSLGYNGFTDTKTILDLEDDAAHVNLGDKWRMPTDVDFTELLNNCTWKWTSMNGIDGRQVTGPNGNSIFLPAAGYRDLTNLYYAGSRGRYWSSSLYTEEPYLAWSETIQSGYLYRLNGSSRCNGQAIRPVYAERCTWETLSEDLLAPCDDYDDGYGMKVLQNKFYVKKLIIDTSRSNYSSWGICMVFRSDDDSHFAAYWNQKGSELAYSFSPENHDAVIVDELKDYGTPVSDNQIEIDFTKYSNKVYIWGYQRNVLLSTIQAYGEFGE